MTQTHEASHHILEWLFPGEYSDGGQKLRYCKEAEMPLITDWEEWQVDTLASVILMPEELVKQVLFVFRYDERTPIINRIHAKKDYERFSMIADFLGISKQALSIRLAKIILHHQIIIKHIFIYIFDIIDLFAARGLLFVKTAYLCGFSEFDDLSIIKEKV